MFFNLLMMFRLITNISILIILVFCFLLLSCSSESEPPVLDEHGTNISGLITINSIWDIDRSPYIVTGDVIVDRNTTLIIQQGVKVLFDGFYGITVKGVLIADGSANNQQGGIESALQKSTFEGNMLNSSLIMFSSNKVEPGAKDWRGIIFDNTNDDKSIIKCSLIKNAETALLCFSSEPQIVDCIIVNNSNGIDCRDSVPKISNNTLTDNAYGIIVSNQHRRAELLVQKSIISYNEFGVFCNELLRGYSLKLQDNDLSHNTEFAIFVEGHYAPVDARSNWWGSIDPKLIAESIHDRNDNLKLTHEVLFQPYATSKITNIGSRCSP